jgi:hypothetical protein
LVARATLSEYLDEHYGDDGAIPYRYHIEDEVAESFAKSHFEADYSLWYDHDFADGNFRQDAIDVARLLKRCAHSASFLDAAVQAAKARRIVASNAALVIYDFGFDQQDADNQLAASRLADAYNKRALLRFIGSAAYTDSSARRAPTPAIDVAKKKRVALMRVHRDHLEMITSVDVWGVERDGDKLTVYRGKRVDQAKKTEQPCTDSSTAQATMKRLIEKQLVAGFRPDTWPRGGYKLKS